MKLRFSMRALLVVTACLVTLCAWWDRPRRIANQFVEAVEAGKYEAADALFAGEKDPFVARFMDRDDRNRIEAEVQPQAPREWLKGECCVTIRLEDFSGLGASMKLNVKVTPMGIGHTSVAEAIGSIKYAPDPILREDIRR